MAKSIRTTVEDRTHPQDRQAEIEQRAAESIARKHWQVRMPSEMDILLAEMQKAKGGKRG